MSTKFWQQFSLSVATTVLLFQPSFAQQNQAGVEPKRLAVDVVSVRGVGRIHGIVLEQTQNDVSIVVRRKWLEETHPAFFKQHLDTETKTISERGEKVKLRIAQWRSELKGEDDLAISEFLDDNEKMLQLDKPLDLSQLAFTIVTIDDESRRRVYSQSKDRHRLAGIGWSENVEGLETMNAKVLKRKLVDRKIDIENYQLRLGNQMPPIVESDEKWAARKALIEFALLPRLEYQGVGDSYFRRGANESPLQALQQMMMQGGRSFSQLDQLGKELGLPEFQDRRTKSEKQSWLKRMVKTAEKEGRLSFSVSKLKQGTTVSVSTTLYFKAADELWYPLKEFSTSEKLSDQNSDDVDQLMQDPQVAKIAELSKQFGLGKQGLLEEAVRSGVATKKALAKSMSDLDEFVDRYSYEIDNPSVE
jgi:hypothetical protein